MSQSTTSTASGAQDEARLQSDGSCRNVIGVWGNQQCSQLPRHVHCRNCPVYARVGRELLDQAPPELDREDRSAPDVQDAIGKSMIVFRIASEWLALPTLIAREIVDPQPAHRIPHRGDPRFLGIVNVRGELLPCVQLAAMLDIKPHAPSTSPAPAPRMLIIEREGSAWAAPVDAIDGVRRFPDDALRAPPVTVELGASRFTRAVIDLPMGRAGLIDEDLLWHALGGICQ